MTTRTTAGPELFDGPRNDQEFDDWRECFLRVLTGVTAAQRTIPDPRKIARIADKIADEGLKCIRACREKTERLEAHQRDQIHHLDGEAG